jgi:hypothetical protein
MILDNKTKNTMNVQVRNNKILAIGEGVLDNGLNEVFPIDIGILPKTEEGDLDYEKIFSATVIFTDNKITELIWDND